MPRHWRLQTLQRFRIPKSRITQRCTGVNRRGRIWNQCRCRQPGDGDRHAAMELLLFIRQQGSPKCLREHMSDSRLYSSERAFSLWRYTTSHGQALFRSNITDDAPTRLEVLFKCVTYIQVPTRLDGLKITESDVSSIKSIRLNGVQIDSDLDSRCFCIESKTGSGLILALAVHFAEDTGDYCDPSSLFIDGVR